MTEKAKLYFDKFIKYGYNHTDFSEEAIQMREGVIFLELIDIEHKLPHSLKGQEQVNSLARELAEIAIVVQGFAIHYFKLFPSKEMSVQDTHRKIPGLLTNDKSVSKIILNQSNPEIDTSIVFLRNLMRGWRSGRKTASASIKLVVGQNKVLLPSEIDYKSVSSILSHFEKYKTKIRKTTSKKAGGLGNQLLHMVEQKVCQYIQMGLLNYYQTCLPPSKTESLISAIVLMAAGYLPTVDEYEKRKQVKDYRTCVDKEYLKKTGDKKKVKKPRYYSYHEILNIQLTQARAKCAAGMQSFILQFN